MQSWTAIVTAALSLLAMAALRTRADVYQSGDLVVTDNHNANMHGVILDVDPVTGAQRVIASGGPLVQPAGLCVGPSGDLIVADFGGSTANDYGRIIRIDHQTGQQSVIATGGMMYYPSAVAVDASGQLLVTARTQDQQYGTVLKINPVTGAQTMFGGPPLLSGSPEGIAISGNGASYFVTDYEGGPNIIAFDAATRSPTVLSTLNSIPWNTHGLAIDRDNPQRLLVAAEHWNQGDGALLAVDAASGSATVLSTGGNLVRPTDVAEDPEGNIYVTAAGLYAQPSGTVFQINPVTGAQTILSQGGSLLTPVGIVVVPEPSQILLIVGTGAIFVSHKRCRR